MQMKPKFASKVVRSLVVVVVVWAVLGVVAVYKARKARTDAGQFLKDIMQVQVGKATLDEVIPLVHRYHGEWRTYERPLCGPGSRTLEFGFDNYWMHLFLFAPLTRLSADIGIKDTHVCARSIGLAAITQAPLGVSVQEFPAAERPRPFDSRLNLFKTIITLTASATSAQRTAAYSLNPDCLVKLRGCRDAREMAPAIWKHSLEVAPTYWKSQWDD